MSHDNAYSTAGLITEGLTTKMAHTRAIVNGVEAPNLWVLPRNSVDNIKATSVGEVPRDYHSDHSHGNIFSQD